PLTTAELRRLLLERGDAGLERMVVEGATLADLDEAQIERYLERLEVAPTESAEQTLLARGSVVTAPSGEFVPTVAGILLFGRQPQRFLPSAELICVRYIGASMGDEFVRQDITGTLPEQIRQAEAFVVSNLRRGMKINGLARVEVTEYPLPVVRE